MDQNVDSKENVVSLFDARKRKNSEQRAKSTSLPSDELFSDIMKKNKDVSDRMKKEREKKNKSVLRSYRIKN